MNIINHLRYKISKESLQKLMKPKPKEVTVNINTNFFLRLFQQSKKSPTYILLQQLFKYLKQTPLIKEEFPFIKSQTRFQQNLMILHLKILKSRIRQQKNRSDVINEQQLQIFNYNAQTYFYPQFAKFLNPQTPTVNFATHYAQSYNKKLIIFDQKFRQTYEDSPSTQNLLYLLKVLVYENRLGIKDVQLIKLSKYYKTHRIYLSMLDWQYMINNKIKWGFQQQRKLLYQ